MTTLASEADWSVLDNPDVIEAVAAAARIIAAKYKDRQVNMLAEYDDLYQDGFILAATKPRLRGLDPALLQFRLTQELNGLVKYRAEHSNNIVYASTLENE